MGFLDQEYRPISDTIGTVANYVLLRKYFLLEIWVAEAEQLFSCLRVTLNLVYTHTPPPSTTQTFRTLCCCCSSQQSGLGVRSRGQESGLGVGVRSQ